MVADDERPPREGALPTGPQKARTRRGIRTAALSAVAFVGLAMAVVAVLITSLSPPEESRRGTRAGGGAVPSEVGGPAIAGTISVAPELTGHLGERDVLFIIARKGPGPPFAVKRILRPRFPLTYRIGPEDMMLAGAPFEGQVNLSARLTTSGGAGAAQPGDLEGEHPTRVAVGARGVDIIITRAR